MRLFRKTDPLELPVAMSGVKLGDRLLVIGCSDARLIARLAVKVGLTGRACAVDDDPARVSGAARIAEREGALIETADAPEMKVPYEAASFDLVVIRNSVPPAPEARTRALDEACRLLRPGGRCLIVQGSTSRGIAGRLWQPGSASVEPASGEDATRALTAASFAAVRTLAEREGLLFVEGVKKNVS
jgi:ubiquinone/menaquinone biosynthesis C-methylase UbiE